MNLRLAFIAAICAVFTGAFAQAHLNLQTQRMLKNAPPEKTTIDLFVRGEAAAVEEAVQAAKGNYKFGYGEYSSVTIPLVSLDAFLKSPAVSGVENGERRMVPLTDTAIIVNCVLPIHNGEAPLDTSYLGDGVIIGIIDFGIDINHPDFIKSNGDTRIRYLWDQYDNDGTKPAPFNYGSEWTEFQINAGQCTHLESDASGHGTNVAGIAAGNGRGCSGEYVGMAPNADLIIVSFDFDALFLSTFMDAVEYIFQKADAMGKPCVINASLGAYWGSHDGKDVAGLLVDSMLEQRNGRMLVCAAGNAGDVPFHLGYDVTSDTSFTWFKYYAPEQNYYYDFWADTQDLKDVYFAVGTDNPAGWKHIAHTPFFNVKQDFLLIPSGNGEYLVDFELEQLRDSSGNFLGNVNIYVFLAQGRYNVEIEVEGPHNPNHYWSFITTGSGRVDGWHSSLGPLAIESSDAVTTGLPDPTVRPDIVHYKLPDLTQNMVSSFTCSDHVLAVGNFTNRHSYLNCNGGFTTNQSPPGQIFGNSSRGPNRQGLTKPDISATGDFTVTSSNISFNYVGDISGQCCGKYRRNGGTSMASPIVAGIAALYLQKYPDADWRQIRDAIIFTAKSDSFTGAVPNNTYGNGKVVGCDAMMVHFRYGCTDSTALNYDSLAEFDDGSCIAIDSGCTDPDAFNYDALANVDDGNCIPRVYGCIDTLAINYDSAANTDDGSCYFVGIGNVLDENIRLAFIPNFFRNETNIVYSFEKSLHGKTAVILTNLLGQQTDEIPLAQDKGSITYRPALGEPGVYFYHLVNEGRTLLSGKLVIY